jgi:hypothetical protein
MLSHPAIATHLQIQALSPPSTPSAPDYEVALLKLTKYFSNGQSFSK